MARVRGDGNEIGAGVGDGDGTELRIGPRIGPERLTSARGALDSAVMNRNKHRLKKANHGKRPANSRRRKSRNNREKKNG